MASAPKVRASRHSELCVVVCQKFAAATQLAANCHKRPGDLTDAEVPAVVSARRLLVRTALTLAVHRIAARPDNFDEGRAGAHDAARSSSQ